MASSIDATKPTRITASTADVRSNFAYAKSEIEALQAAVAVAASETVSGIIELATTAEVVTGTDSVRAVTPAGVGSRFAAPGPIGGTTPGSGVFTTVRATGMTSGYAVTDSSGNVSTSGFHGAPPTARYYFGDTMNGNAAVNVTVAANALYVIPFNVPFTATVTKVGLGITSSGSATSEARLGIYRWANGAPTSLVVDAGTVAATSATDVEATVSQGLAPGEYALSFVASESVGIRGNSAMNEGYYARAGMGAPGSLNLQVLNRAFSYAALPATWGTVSYSTGSVPFMWARF